MPLLIEGYGARVLIRGAPASIAAELRDLLPPQVSVATVDARAEADAHLTVMAAEDGVFRLLRGDELVAQVRTGETLLESVRTQVELAIAVYGRAGTFVHAGAVGWRSVVILIPGSSYAGKSTLVAALVSCGAVYYSDEYAVIDAAGRVHPYARPIHLRPYGRQLRPVAGSEPLNAALVVATAYQPGAAWAPLVRKGVRALLPVLDNVVVMKDRPMEGLRLAARLAPRVVALQGQRPEASQVAPAILTFLDRVLDGDDVGA